jgi:hypothetical protein
VCFFSLSLYPLVPDAQTNEQLRGRLLDGRCYLGEDNRQGGESSGMTLDWWRGCELGTSGATGKRADREGQLGG